MRLSRLGDYVDIIDERNKDGRILSYMGLNKNKEFMPTVASTDDVDPSKYKVVRKGNFVFSGMQTGRDQCIRIGLSESEEPFLVSPAYTTFRVKNVIPEYFFMIFKSNEMDRHGWFISDSSIRSNLDWDRFCEIGIEIPSLDIQLKFVNVYKALVANQKVLENGLNDLKTTCNAYVERLKCLYKSSQLKPYINPIEEKNTQLKITLAQGVNTEKSFVSPRQVADDKKNAQIVRTRQFAYNTATTRNGEKISIALRTGPDCVVSSAYQVFEVSRKQELLPEYLLVWFMRSEFDRYVRYNSWGSAHEFFTFDDMCRVEIPIPGIDVQKSIVAILVAYERQKQTIITLKRQISDICPILIKGSIEEALRG